MWREIHAFSLAVCLERGAESIEDPISGPGDLHFSAPAADIPRGSENCLKGRDDDGMVRLKDAWVDLVGLLSGVKAIAEDGDDYEGLELGVDGFLSLLIHYVVRTFFLVWDGMMRLKDCRKGLVGRIEVDVEGPACSFCLSFLIIRGSEN